MAKRQKLVINSEDLVHTLKQSAGQGVDAFFSSPSPTPKQAPEAPKPALERVAPAPAVSQVLELQKWPIRGSSTNLKSVAFKTQPVSQSSDRSVNQPVDPAIDPPVDWQLTGEVVERPVAFYIPKVIDERIEEALDYMQQRHGVQVDRSALVSAILGNPAVWEPESLTQLVDRAVHQLTSRLTNRLTSRSKR